MTQFNKLHCPFCGSQEVHCEKKYSNPIHLDIKAFVFMLSTVIQKSTQIIKCHKCGYESNTKIRI